MTEISPVYMQVRQLALVLLKGEENPTPQSIRNKVDIAIMASKSAGADGDVDAEAIAKEIESLYSVWIDTGKALDDKTDHKPWLPDKRAQIEWKFWRRYERYLEEEMGWPPQVVNRLGDLTDSILERLEDSERPAPWDRRGMVVGSVQSGKTANYTGLICKAVDAGYKLVIILAGMHNSLRSQTQLRIDEGVLGFDTQKSRKFNQDSQRIGVGLLQNEPLFIHSLTNSAEHGDFKRNIADTVGVMIGGDPVILVVKKNKSVLNNLIQWALTVRGHMDTATRKRMIRNVPLLLIDDEADNASINTKKLPDPVNGQLPDDYDVTAINEKIRELLSSFDKCAYVGYTATPFANIFINPDCSTQRLGDDIFPRSFIINLPVSSNYVGPARVFGLDSDPDAGIEGLDPLPIIRVVKDYDAFFPENHKKDLAVPGLPKSLKEAIRAFILTCATRWTRGQISVHNSMLIHVTRYVDVQRQITQLVRDELASLKRRIAYGDGNSPRKIRSELESLWKNDFEPTSLAMPDYVPNQVSWEEVNEALHAATSKIEVKEINGTAMDILDYVEHSGGRSVIAIGGDKLSRGLTLEGLSISYYLRASKMYDTLMQMGRWFGYRPGYLDLCRLYTTRDLVQWYRHITLAEQELRREFEYMWSSGRTPSDYGLRVRTHPEGLLITALNKMREGVTMQLSYAGELVETAHFYTDANIIRKNIEITSEFIGSLGPCKKVEDKEHCVWHGVPASRIINGFLDGLEIHPDARKADRRRLADYIKAQLTRNELTDWTVALISNSQTKNRKAIGGQEVGLTFRENDSTRDNVYSLKKSHILNPADQYIDFLNPTEPQLEGLFGRSLQVTIERWRDNKIKGKEEPKVPNGRVVRELRPATHGLLIIYPLDPDQVQSIKSSEPVIGFAISFPTSERARTVEYKVTKRYLELESEMDDEQ